MKVKAVFLLFLTLLAFTTATTAVTITMLAPNVSVSLQRATHVAGSHVRPLGDPVDDPFFPL